MNIPNSPEAVLKERLENEYEDNICRSIDLIEFAKTLPDRVDDDETMKKLAETQRDLKKAEKVLITNHKTEKDLYLGLGRIVDRTLKDRSSDAKAAADRLGQITGNYAYRKQQEEERIRLAGIEKARLEAQAAAKAAADAEHDAYLLAQQAEYSKESVDIHTGDNISQDIKNEMEAEANVDKINAEAEAVAANNARLEAERLQDEASLAALKPAVKASTISGGHVRTSWVPQIINKAEIDLNILRQFISDAEIIKAAKAAHKAGITTIPGIIFNQDIKAIV